MRKKDINMYFFYYEYKGFQTQYKAGGDDWQKEPGTEILSEIENFPTVVIAAEIFKR